MINKIFESIKSLGGKLYRGSKAFLKSIFANADSILKLVGSLAIVSGALLVHSYESKLSAVTLISEREQAQSQLRASMFSNLITPISGPSKEKEIGPHRERVLVELLALNFHEDFEFKPLMLHVDKRLSKSCNPNCDVEKNDEKIISKEQAKEDRASLRSIARRITSKQIKTLIKEGLPYPIETLSFEVPILKIADVKSLDNKIDVKGLNNKLVEKKVVLKDSDDLLYFYHKSKNKLKEVLKYKNFTESEIDSVLVKFQELFIKQNPIKVKKEDFKDNDRINRLITNGIVEKGKGDNKKYLLFNYGTTEELETKLMRKDFKAAEINIVLNKLQKSLMKQDSVEVEKKYFTDKGLINRLVKKGIVVEVNGGKKDYLLFNYETSEELTDKLMNKDFKPAEIKYVFDKLQESFMEQGPIDVKKEDFKDKDLINRLITNGIVVEDSEGEKDCLLFDYETSEKLTDKLMNKDFKPAEIKYVFDKLQKSFMKQDSIEVNKEYLKDKSLLNRLITNEIAVEGNGSNKGYLLFNHESENKLKNRLEKEGFEKEERLYVLSRYSISLTKHFDDTFILKIPGDENNRILRVSLKDIDSYNETVEVNFNIDYVEDEEATDDTFTLTWYDFPFTDYTILNNGIRFSLILDKIDLIKNDEKSKYVVALKIIWYPKDFFTAHERPINYKVFRKNLGISD